MAVSGRDGGARKNDADGAVTTAAMLQAARSKFTRRVLSALGFTENTGIDLEFEVGEQVLPPVAGGGLIIRPTVKEMVTVPFGDDSFGVISIDTLNGEIQAGLSETISEIQGVSTEASVNYDVSGILTDVAYAVRSGAMQYSFTINSDGSGTFSISIGTDDLQSVEGVSGTIGIQIDLDIQFTDSTAYQWIEQSETVVRIVAYVSLALLGIAQGAPSLAATVGQFLLEYFKFLIPVPVLGVKTNI